MARPREYTAKEICDACEGTGGILALVASKLGCDRVTVWRYAQRYSSVREALEQADEAITDIAEAKAAALIKAEYWPAIRYRLSTKGKRRGYVERQEHTGADGAPVSVTYSIDDWKAKRAGRLQEAERTVEMFDDEDTDA